jgi:hypothetical protein
MKRDHPFLPNVHPACAGLHRAWLFLAPAGIVVKAVGVPPVLFLPIALFTAVSILVISVFARPGPSTSEPAGDAAPSSPAAKQPSQGWARAAVTLDGVTVAFLAFMLAGSVLYFDTDTSGGELRLSGMVAAGTAGAVALAFVFVNHRVHRRAHDQR